MFTTMFTFFATLIPCFMTPFVLELQESHIEYVFKAATTTTPPLLCPQLATLASLPTALQQWTGGSPRLLVYSLRALHHLYKDEVVSSNTNTEEAMDQVYQILRHIPAVASEVFLARDDEANWRQTWLYLILLAQLHVPCQRHMTLPVGPYEHKLDLLLGRLNVYIRKPSAPIKDMPDAFYICHMKMVEKFVREKYSSDCRVQLFLGAEATGVSAADLLEHMVEQRIVVQACLCQEERAKWGDVMKPLLKGTKAESLEVVLDRGCPLNTFPKVTSATMQLKEVTLPLPKQLHRSNLAAAMNCLNSNRMYRPGPKSSSADLFIKQPHLTIEVQDKSGVSAGVSFSDVCEEVEKCIKEGPVLWVLLALKLTESLGRWVGKEKPLVLIPGVYQEENHTGGGLLYSPNTKKTWQKRILHGEWLDVSSKETKGDPLKVRHDLELVIPHPSHVKTFLGDDDFEIVKQLAERTRHEVPGRVVSIPFLSRFYNFKPPHRGRLERDLVCRFRPFPVKANL